MTAPLRRALLGAAMLGGACAWPGPAPAHEPASSSAAAREAVVAHRTPVHPVALLDAAEGAWSVSRTETGCFLLSATRKKASRLALGRDAAGAFGLYAIDLALTTPGRDTLEPVELRLGDTDLPFTGQVIGNRLLYVPLSPELLDRSLRTLADTGVLWLGLRGSWLSHGGQNLPAMVAEYGKQCAAPPKPAAATPATPVATAAPGTAKPGSKAAASP